MRTIIVAAVIAILAGIIYQKIVEENTSIKDIALYVSGTTSKVIDEAVKNDDNKNSKDIEQNLNTISENTSAIIQDIKEKFIKEQMPEIWQNITCDKALSIYEDYSNGKLTINKNEENIYNMLNIMRQNGASDKYIKDNIIALFCNENIK